MINLKNEIIRAYGLNLELKSFGDNEARNNVFLGEGKDKSFIVKLEDVNQLHQVKLSIYVATNLLKSSLVSSSRYVKTKDGENFHVIEDKVVTVQKKEDLISIKFETREDFKVIGEVIGEFHLLLSNMNIKGLKKSDFYKDFMWGKVPLAQSPKRLEEIELFYKKYTPNYELLTKGVVHNDLNLNNIFFVGEKYFLIDFEFLKESPMISDLGVLALELWDYKKGAQDYINKLNYLVEGYEKKFKLSQYDKDKIVNFSLRYLFSDENWYNYWSFNGNKAVRELIPVIREKQNLLLKIIS
ncbi:Homoserine kinase [bioreactor metagenome]|uniref:Homoserine kinase n=1 Tax=bioreactor metagenome TaxID=1076179 RepID=A0A645CSF6_9ZZZZ